VSFLVGAKSRSPSKPWRSRTNQNKNKKGAAAMKREKKKQDDRLLKRLSRAERKQQELLRHYIQSDPFFKLV